MAHAKGRLFRTVRHCVKKLKYYNIIIIIHLCHVTANTNVHNRISYSHDWKESLFYFLDKFCIRSYFPFTNLNFLALLILTNIQCEPPLFYPWCTLKVIITQTSIKLIKNLSKITNCTVYFHVQWRCQLVFRRGQIEMILAIGLVIGSIQLPWHENCTDYISCSFLSGLLRNLRREIKM